MAANVITLIRILLVFVVVVLFQMGFYHRCIAVILTILVLYLDSLDGYVARKLSCASDFGALFDITGDRIVEHIYLIYYAAVGVVSFWVPMIFITRSFLVDTLRNVAYAKTGKTPFGEKTMMTSSITRFLTGSRFMRGLYGAMKVILFVVLGVVIAYKADNPRFLPVSLFAPNSLFMFFTQLLVWITVVLNIIRGLPVLYDGREYLFDKSMPRELKDEV
jgi:CDP-diacylglycerol--glycerol-3-phosphate 3-phosphatidyltransferase